MSCHTGWHAHGAHGSLLWHQRHAHFVNCTLQVSPPTPPHTHEAPCTVWPHHNAQLIHAHATARTSDILSVICPVPSTHVRRMQVIQLIEKPRDPPLEFVVADTPGQIEIFTWSASGAIITELLASTFPTCVLYVVDTPRCTEPQTFMSNMLQAVSILYKTKLPMVLVRVAMGGEASSGVRARMRASCAVCGQGPGVNAPCEAKLRC